MRKIDVPPALAPHLMEAAEGWTKTSEYLYVHETGARIERKGYPEQPGWYLTFPKEAHTTRRFAPNTEGCDEAFVAFAGKRALAAYLNRILRTSTTRRAG